MKKQIFISSFIFILFNFWIGLNRIVNAQVIEAGLDFSYFVCKDKTYNSWGWNYYGQMGNGLTSNSSIPVSINTLTNIKAISAGYAHTLFLTTDGIVWACGDNFSGQYGNGTTIESHIPTKINSLNGVISIAAGTGFSLFLINDGTVWACGWNDKGQLGDGTQINKHTPVQIIGLTGIIAISAGYKHSIFLKNDGTVWACGDNTYGEIGDGTTTNKLTPIKINSLTGITAISAGSDHSLFLKNDGTVWGCGHNDYGQFGDGTYIDKDKPVQVKVITGIISIETGYSHSLFLKNDGTVWGCGSNGNGTLGDGTTYPARNTPIEVKSLTGITAISGGNDYSLFLKNDGTLWACGKNDYGQLGDGTTTLKSIPIQIPEICNCNVTAEAGINLTVCSGASVTLSATGGNNYQWSDGVKQGIPFKPIVTKTYTVTVTDVNNCTVTDTVTITVNPLPTAEAGLNQAVFAGESATLSATGGSSYQWSDGVLQGVPFSPDRSKTYTVTVTDIKNCSASDNVTIIVNPVVAAGDEFSLFICSDKSSKSWGLNNYGQLGDGTRNVSHIPINVLMMNSISVAASNSFSSISLNMVGHSLFIKNDGTVWACGGNGYGELGDGTTTVKTTPVQINSLSGIIAIAAGANHSLFLKNDGTVWACGGNGYGELGDGTTTVKKTPVQINSLSGIIAIAAGASHSLFLKNDGTVWACGGNGYGELGDGTTTVKTTPVQINSLSGIIAISAGSAHSLFLKNDETVWACGGNGYGELGDGTTTVKLSPVQINSLTGISAISAGDQHSLFVKNDGSVWACGGNTYGQLGDGTTNISKIPIKVNGLCSCNTVAEAGANQTVCSGVSVILSATGGTSYQWSEGITQGVPFIPTSTKTYTVTVTDANNCTAKDSVIVFVNPLPTAEAGLNQAVFPSESATLSATGGVSYQWSDEVIQGVPFKPIITKIYLVTVTDANNCLATDKVTIFVNPILGAGMFHSLFICNDHIPKSWGMNNYGQLGFESLNSILFPNQVSSLNGIIAVYTGDNTTHFIKNDGTIWACGDNDYGQLGGGTSSSISIPIQINSLTGITSIAGGRHTLFLKDDGTVWACGINFSGQYGNGTTTISSSPIQVRNGVSAVAVGGVHSLFLQNDSTVWACGGNSNGVLGDGTTIGKISPVKINSLSGIIKIASGFSHSLFLRKDGTVWACGNNDYGQLGDGTTTMRTTPVQITSLTGIIAISSLEFHSLFLKNDGTVWACGRNDYGQLGDGTTIMKTTPIQISSLNGIIAIAAGGAYSLFLKNDGTVWASGYNHNGELGDGSTIDKSIPVKVTGLCSCNIVAEADTNQTICTGSSVTLSATGGTSYQWSDGIIQGVPFIPTSTKTYTVTVTDINNCSAKDSVIVFVNPLPKAEAGLNQTVLIGANIILSATGGVDYHWADGVEQGVPFKPLATRTFTVTVTDANNCTATDNVSVTVNNRIAAGDQHSLFLCGDKPFIVGVIKYDPNSTLPKIVQQNFGQAGSLQDITYIAAGELSSFFQKSDGTLWASGENGYGNLADGSTIYRTSPVQINTISGVKAIAAGGAHTLFLKNDSTVWACGGNILGQLGNGTTSFSSSPIPLQINTLKNIVAVSAGHTFSLFLKSDGTVWACGSNNFGQLGDGTTINKSTPVQIPSLNGIVAIETGFDQSFFLKSDGAIYACGWNVSGELGDGTTISRSIPVQITSLSGIVSISAHEDHTLFLKNDGTVWACGWNLQGQLGDGTNIERDTPIQIPTLSGVVAISAGWGHSLFLKEDGTLWACGSNKYSQLGDGTTTNRTTPVQISDPCACIISAEAGANQTICSGASVTLSATGGTSYQWSDGIIQGVPFIPTSTKTYTVTVTDINNCSAKDSVIVFVNPLPKAEAGNLQIVCAGTSVVLSATGGTSYQWNNGVTQGVLFTPTVTTTYFVTVTNSNNCSAADSVPITVNPLPIADAGIDQTICAGESVIFLATGGDNYQWSDGIKQGAPFKPYSTKTYKVTVTDINKCSATDEVLITVNPSPSADFNINPTEIQPNDTVTFNSLNVKNADTWKWDFGDGNISYDSINIQHIYKYEGKFNIILSVFSVKNCEKEITKSINVILKSKIWIPTAFTPNGDGVNDILYVLGELKSMHLEIYDQWGILVFTSDNQQFGWDGKYRGIDQSVGNYTYVIDILKDSGNKVFDSGTITLIR